MSKQNCTHFHHHNDITKASSSKYDLPYFAEMRVAKVNQTSITNILFTEDDTEEVATDSFEKAQSLVPKEFLLNIGAEGMV